MTEISNKPSVKSRLVILLVRLLAKLPLSLAKALLRPLVWMQRLLPNRSKAVIDMNLAVALGDLSSQKRKQIRNNVLRFSTNLIAESCHIWTSTYTKNRRLISKANIEPEFDVAVADGRGDILISPHLGNWELTYAYFANEYNSAGLYRPPKIPELESLMLEGRQGGGEIIKTHAMEVRKMLRLLKSGERLFLLPDQHPPKGSGVYAPFFGYPAYTMTLLYGLLKRTNARLWMAYCVQGAEGYELTLQSLPEPPLADDIQFASYLNEQLERVIKQAPEQYQWSYKRFKTMPDGSPSIYS